MDSLKFRDVRVEKSHEISKYRRILRITTLFRLVELFVFLVIVVRFCSQFHFSVKSSGEYFRGRFSDENSGKGPDIYDEYVEKCRRNHQSSGNEKLRDMGMNRSKSEKVLRVAHVDDRRRELRRSVTERYSQRTANSERKNAAANGGITSYCAEDEMSSAEFRQAVEAFIARQQRLLREEEALSDV
ncbi:uncharacterized protein LOC142544863 [Primulina tabacum]|uniref:uncharacterized protein LOC142544863 n=1 Tax=Primulina tabacum TaxID=48773 RepID=UPI003F5A04BB